jgi:hypothetical protein
MGVEKSGSGELPAASGQDDVGRKDPPGQPLEQVRPVSSHLPAKGDRKGWDILRNKLEKRVRDREQIEASGKRHTREQNARWPKKRRSPP